MMSNLNRLHDVDGSEARARVEEFEARRLEILETLLVNCTGTGSEDTGVRDDGDEDEDFGACLTHVPNMARKSGGGLRSGQS